MMFVDELHSPLSMERDPRAPLYSVAKSLPSMANRNILWSEDAADRSSGILGIHLAGAQKFMAFSEVDRGNGALCPSRAQEFVSLPSVARRRRAFKHDIDFAALATTYDLCG
jgi:hypothetical protein